MINERRNAIRTYIAEHRTVRMEELAALYPNVSVMTLRRDLAALEEEGTIIRVRGGAGSTRRISARQKTFTAVGRFPILRQRM